MRSREGKSMKAHMDDCGSSGQERCTRWTSRPEIAEPLPDGAMSPAAVTTSKCSVGPASAWQWATPARRSSRPPTPSPQASTPTASPSSSSSCYKPSIISFGVVFNIVDNRIERSLAGLILRVNVVNRSFETSSPNPTSSPSPLRHRAIVTSKTPKLNQWPKPSNTYSFMSSYNFRERHRQPSHCP